MFLIISNSHSSGQFTDDEILSAIQTPIVTENIPKTYYLYPLLFKNTIIALDYSFLVLKIENHQLENKIYLEIRRTFLYQKHSHIRKRHSIIILPLKLGTSDSSRKKTIQN